MRDLSLHILDLVENAIRAGATLVGLTIEEDPGRDLMRIVVEDNGPGLKVTPETAMDPFYTTKRGKKTGLGLSLMRAAAERAGGGLTLRSSTLGGLLAEANMKLSHIDRSPLGDIPASVSSLVCATADLDIWCRLRVGDRESVIRASDVAREAPGQRQRRAELARRMAERIRTELASLDIVP
jgi:hypothetical protein